MKKVMLIFIGCLLFVAGYYHIHRQTRYTTARQNPVKTNRASSTTDLSGSIKAEPAFILPASKHFTF